MKSTILLTACFVMMVGCSTPNPNTNATSAAYEQLKPGMSRAQVYALLGQPDSTHPAGKPDICRTVTWSIPNDSHGFGHMTVIFDGDMVSVVKRGMTTFTRSR